MIHKQKLLYNTKIDVVVIFNEFAKLKIIKGKQSSNRYNKNHSFVNFDRASQRLFVYIIKVLLLPYQ